jgi:hypothetical protein
MARNTYGSPRGTGRAYRGGTIQSMFRSNNALVARCRWMRHRMLKNALIAAAASFTAVELAAAQPNLSHDAETMNFDLWCQEQLALLPARCDKRSAEDESAFEAYLTKVERYEIPHRSAQYDQGRVNRDIMNNDPIDNPQKDNLGAQQQYPNISVTDPQSK